MPGYHNQLISFQGHLAGISPQIKIRDDPEGFEPDKVDGQLYPPQPSCYCVPVDKRSSAICRAAASVVMPSATANSKT
jgi:hypothetical protein